MSHLPGLLLQLWINQQWSSTAAAVSSVGVDREELGFEPGDQLLSINGIRPRLIDYRYLCVEEELCPGADAKVRCIGWSWRRMPMTALGWPCGLCS